MNSRILVLFGFPFVFSLCPAQGPRIVTPSRVVRLNEVGPPADEGPKRWEAPLPGESVSPPSVPMPGGGAAKGVRLVSKDLRAGRVKVYPPPAKVSGDSGFVTGSNLRNRAGGVEGWGNAPSRIWGVTTFPYSSVCRIFYTTRGMKFKASGLLISPNVVLTAGHVVHEGRNGTWCKNITVSPAWNGSDMNFGSGRAVKLYTWSAWINSSDSNHDIGLIQLDRPVGFLADYMGYGFNKDSFFKGRQFRFSGYPWRQYGGAPDAMYGAKGTFDTVLQYRFRSSAPWPYKPYGMDGAGVYYESPTWVRTAYGVLTGYSVYWSGNLRKLYHARITQNKFSYIRGTVVPNAFPSGRVDLVPLNVRAEYEGKAVQAGLALSRMTYVLCNASNYDPPVKTYKVDVYLSSNDNISKADRKIQHQALKVNFSPRMSVTVYCLGKGAPVIPADVKAGTYWIGVIVDEKDYNTANNETDGWDAAKITVAGCPVTAPSGYGAVEGDSSTLEPGCFAPSKCQLLYDASVLKGVPFGVITGLALRRDGLLNGSFQAHSSYITVHMSAFGVNGAGSWSRTSYSANRGKGCRLVFPRAKVDFPAVTRPAVTPARFSVELPFANPIAYLPGRNMMVEMDVADPSGGNNFFYWGSDAVIFGPYAKKGTTEKFGKGCPSGRIMVGEAPPVDGLSKLSWYWDSGAGKGTPALGILGTSRTRWGSLALPFSLTGMGAPGCSLYTDLVLAFPGVTRGILLPGLYRVEVPVPADSTLAGGVLYGQTFVFDKTYNSLGVRASEGMKFTLGTPRLPSPAFQLTSNFSMGKPPFPDKPHLSYFSVPILALRGL